MFPNDCFIPNYLYTGTSHLMFKYWNSNQLYTRRYIYIHTVAILPGVL